MTTCNRRPVFERDHIMRQINLLSQALIRALSLRTEGREAEALKELDRAVKDFSGNTDAGPPDSGDLFARCISDEGKVQPYAYDLASILTLRGDVLVESGLVDPARINYELAQSIYRAAVDTPQSTLPWDIQDRMDDLAERLQDSGAASDD